MTPSGWFLVTALSVRTSVFLTAVRMVNINPKCLLSTMLIVVSIGTTSPVKVIQCSAGPTFRFAEYLHVSWFTKKRRDNLELVSILLFKQFNIYTATKKSNNMSSVIWWLLLIEH